ncbi:TetR family transcriptional regulator [Rhodobacteraceae bacterium F11138]|nr:TetR family transcriptional regulator [Rhodobacteraceae bacterium F11138]
MIQKVVFEKQRQRAPSKRALQSRERILDAAERVFARKGFDGATIREIAAEAGTQVGLVHHHGGGKATLFARTVERRAAELSDLRLGMLDRRKAAGPVDLSDILECFFAPYLQRAAEGEPQWLAYARLVAHVSADPRWHSIAVEFFDPTANRFIDEIGNLFPKASRGAIASGFVYSVSAMLALLTSEWRIEALGEDPVAPDARLQTLVSFCAAGIAASLAQ